MECLVYHNRFRLRHQRYWNAAPIKLGSTLQLKSWHSLKDHVNWALILQNIIHNLQWLFIRYDVRSVDWARNMVNMISANNFNFNGSIVVGNYYVICEHTNHFSEIENKRNQYLEFVTSFRNPVIALTFLTLFWKYSRIHNREHGTLV